MLHNLPAEYTQVPGNPRCILKLTDQEKRQYSKKQTIRIKKIKREPGADGRDNKEYKKIRLKAIVTSCIEKEQQNRKPEAQRVQTASLPKARTMLLGKTPGQDRATTGPAAKPRLLGRFQDVVRNRIKVMSFTTTPEKIMIELGKERLKAFEQFWEDHDNDLDMNTFCQLIVDTFVKEIDQNMADAAKYELVYGCIKLFKEVDINGDGGMEWTEFLQYMLEAVSGNTIKGPNLEDEDNDDIIKPEQVQVQVKKIKASVFSRFLISNKFRDTQTHLNKI